MSVKKHIYHQPQFGEDWFTYKQFYTEMVRKYPSGSTFVEIGSWKGKSAAFILTEIINAKKTIDFYCVDTWEGSIEHQQNLLINNLYDTFLKNMKTFEGSFAHFKTKSTNAVHNFEDKSIDFVFIDGSHEYEDVKNDIIMWLPKLKKGGTLAGHDYQECFYSVIKAVNECIPIFTVDTEQKIFYFINE